MAAVPECDDEDEWQSLIFSASVDTDIWLYSGQVRRSSGLWTSSRTESSVQCRWKIVMTSRHRFTALSHSNQSIPHQNAPFNMGIYGRTCAKIHLFSSVSPSCPGRNGRVITRMAVIGWERHFEKATHGKRMRILSHAFGIRRLRPNQGERRLSKHVSARR
jgi:hypothetical protein